MLTLFSYIYWLLWSIRKYLINKRFLKIKRLSSPVISVGNLTAGGTGKTPAVIAITKLLQSRIPSIAILSRGYKRRSNARVIVVSDGEGIISTPEASGDEPFLIASILRHIPVIVAADRYIAGQIAAERFHSGLFILDDGYQHIRLHRDINILLIDASNPAGNGYLLPRGILREPLSEMARADCIIITRANEGDVEIAEGLVRAYNTEAPLFTAHYRTTSLTDLEGNLYSPDIIASKRLYLFSGIGNPASFRRSVEDIRGIIVGEMTFQDHHWYDKGDIEKILGKAVELSADIILTTEKDAIRIMGTSLMKNINQTIEILALQIEMEIDREFQDWIINGIGQILNDTA